MNKINRIHTMLPGSVDARAKMKIAFGHAEALPVSNSFFVLDSCRGVGGPAATRLIVRRGRKVARSFMVKGISKGNE